jgi:hypothetical protein
MNSATITPVPRWLAVVAWLTVVAALPLVSLGAEVTTKKVGMADQVGLRNPLHLFEREHEQPGEPIRLLYLFNTEQYGMLIEHGHRLAGFVVGVLCIVLALGMAFATKSAFFRSLGFVALSAVSLQGILGIYRVDLNALFGPSLALIHGCTAQLVFATLVAVAVMCSSMWSRPPETPCAVSTLSAFGLCAMIFLMIIFGAIMRHSLDPIAQRLHIIIAFGIVLKVWFMVAKMHTNTSDRAALRVGYLLLALVLIQPIFGVEAWIRRFGAGVYPDQLPANAMLDLIRSSHHVIGTVIFATSVAMATMIVRPKVAVQTEKQSVVASTSTALLGSAV